jgi:methyl-accepting chemotaxis protein
MFLVTWWITAKQETDALVINLAGRQRMLSQKITKDIFHFQLLAEAQGKAAGDLSGAIADARQVFDKTLRALKDSGDAPMSLNLATADFRFCPRAEEPAYSQLAKVEGVWRRFDTQIDQALKKERTSQDSFGPLHQTSLELLLELNRAVEMRWGNSSWCRLNLSNIPPPADG